MILRAYSLAYAGRGGEAIAEAERALALERQLGLRNAYLSFIFARICVLANTPDEAIDQLEETLRRRDFFFTRVAANRFDVCAASRKSSIPATRVEQRFSEGVTVESAT